ncbi:MAG TPA: LON peptidase substrate-binding domain-containing protein, partial [Anaerolineales bacterium]
MKDNDWYVKEDSDDFGEALHRRTEELYNIPDAVPDADGLIECPVLGLRDLVIYPHMVSPLFVGRDVALRAIEEAQANDQTIIALTQRDSEKEDPGEDDYYPIGVELAVGRLLNMPDGSNSALVQGRRRVELVEFTQLEPYPRARVQPIIEVADVDRQTDATMRTALEMFQHCVQLDRRLPEESYLFALNIEEPGWLADMITTTIAPSLEERMGLLQMVDPIERLKRVVNVLAQEVDVLELEDEIHTRAQGEVDRTQREYFLREQMKVIQNELGEGDAWTRELFELRTRIESLGLSEEVKMRTLKEIDRLGQMPPSAPEVGIIRTYIDWIIDLPWTQMTEDNLDVRHAAKILEQYHYGLPRAKERILEYIAVRSLKPRHSRQPILCFVGPPGTGKT